MAQTPKPKVSTKKRKPVMTLTIDFFEDGTADYNMTKEVAVGLGIVERICRQAGTYVQRVYAEESYAQNAKDRELAKQAEQKEDA